jgi:hypothetical protein
MNPLMNTMVGMAMFVMGIISVTGNFVVMYVFAGERMRSPSNMLVVNLAFAGTYDATVLLRLEKKESVTQLYPKSLLKFGCCLLVHGTKPARILAKVLLARILAW